MLKKEKLAADLEDRFLIPRKVIGLLNIRKGHKVADFGCGRGYFTFPMAEKVGESGKIYAYDEDPEIIELIQRRCEQDKVDNVKIELKDLDEELSEFNEMGLDLVLISNIYHQVEKRKQLLTNAFNILYERGWLFIVEWNHEKTSLGPPMKYRFSPAEVRKEFLAVGLEEVHHFEKLGVFHYGFLFQKKEKNENKN